MDCSDSCAIENYWCDIRPGAHARVDVSEGTPGRISCIIPNATGQDVLVFNQYGMEIRYDPTLGKNVRQLPLTNTQNENRTYELEVLWTSDAQVQDQLRIVQCVGIFHGTSHLCRTAVVNINFLNEHCKYGNWHKNEMYIACMFAKIGCTYSIV